MLFSGSEANVQEVIATFGKLMAHNERSVGALFHRLALEEGEIWDTKSTLMGSWSPSAKSVKAVPFAVSRGDDRDLDLPPGLYRVCRGIHAVLDRGYRLIMGIVLGGRLLFQLHVTDRALPGLVVSFRALAMHGTKVAVRRKKSGS